MGLERHRLSRWRVQKVKGSLEDGLPGPQQAPHRLLPEERDAFLALAGVLMEPDGSLEGAVVRSSLATVLLDFETSMIDSPDQVVTRFLAESFYRRLVLDLGEPLEAAGLSFGHWRQGLHGLKNWIAGAAAVKEPAEPATPEQWRGLAGWTWVTLTLETMLRGLRE